MGVINLDQLEEIRKKHSKIALCSGCYDVLQSGHAVFFNQCKEFADILVVSVGRDSIIRSLKGESRPFNPENNRLHLVSALKNVDYAVLGGSEMLPGKIDFAEVLTRLKPDVFVLNDNDSAVKEKKELCDKLGIELKLVKRTVPEHLKPTSSTEIIEKINNEKL